MTHGSAARSVRQNEDDDVLNGLRAPRKHLPNRLLYEGEGAELFERVTASDAYYPARTELALLRQVGKHSCVAVPIMLGGSAWGELWAARGSGLAEFAPRDVRFLETIAGQIAAAVGRTELYARMADLAFKATIPRRIPSGDIGDTDIYGAQQHAPLLDVEVPIS